MSGGHGAPAPRDYGSKIKDAGNGVGFSGAGIMLACIGLTSLTSCVSCSLHHSAAPAQQAQPIAQTSVSELVVAGNVNFPGALDQMARSVGHIPQQMTAQVKNYGATGAMVPSWEIRVAGVPQESSPEAPSLDTRDVTAEPGKPDIDPRHGEWIQGHQGYDLHTVKLSFPDSHFWAQCLERDPNDESKLKVVTITSQDTCRNSTIATRFGSTSNQEFHFQVRFVPKM